MVLDRPVHDVDLATPARPEVIESLFAKTLAVGKAFGTIVVVEQGHELQVTTFRADGVYGDGRRPDDVVFGTDLEVDARRRDFTCNALYLDPLTDEAVDPVGGLADLHAGLLRCVGDPEARFREDGLRLLRLARFAAVYSLRIDPLTLEAARRSLDSLAGVSVERVYAELASAAKQGAAPAALRLLFENGILARALPGLCALHPPGGDGATAMEHRLAALERFGDRADLEGVLALLFDPLDPAREPEALALLEALRPPKAVCDGVRRRWRMARAVRAPAAGDPSSWQERAARIRLVRAPEWESFVALGRAWNEGRGAGEPLTELLIFASSLDPEELHPTPFLTSPDLVAAGIPPSPRFGELLREAEDLQLGGAHRSREEALAWLAARARGRE